MSPGDATRSRLPGQRLPHRGVSGKLGQQPLPRSEQLGVVRIVRMGQYKDHSAPLTEFAGLLAPQVGIGVLQHAEKSVILRQCDGQLDLVLVEVRQKVQQPPGWGSYGSVSV